MSIKSYNKGNYRAKDVLGYDISVYQPEVLQSGMLTQKEIRSEYMRLKSVARKRLIRLEKAGFADTEVYKSNKGMYPAQSKLSDADISYKLADLAKFIASKTSTVSGEKAYIRENVQTLQEHGYNITEKNFLAFTKFMDYYRETEIDKIYSSMEIVEVFEKNKTDGQAKVNQIMADFKAWQQGGET